jgi:hypothetical protein
MNNLRQEFSLPPRPSKPEKPVRLIAEIQKLSETIIDNCENDQLVKASEKMTLLNEKLDEIDDNTMLNLGTGTLKEIVSALQVIQSANRMVISKGLAATAINNPIFNI